MTRARIVDTVRKLLALANHNPSVEEASNAAARAQHLMTKHAITQAMLDAEDPSRKVEVVGVELLHTHSAKNMPQWKRVLGRVMAEVNQCHVFKHGNALRIIGVPSDIEGVRMLFPYVVQEIEHLADAESAICGSPGRVWKNNFRMGATYAVCERLEKAHKAERSHMRYEANLNDSMGSGAPLAVVDTALARLDDRRSNALQWAADNLNLRKGRGRHMLDKDGRDAGKRAGADIDLSNRTRRALT